MALRSLKDWLRLPKVWDAISALSDGSSIATRQFLAKLFGRSDRPRISKPMFPHCRPEVERFEERSGPTDASHSPQALLAGALFAAQYYSDQTGLGLEVFANPFQEDAAPGRFHMDVGEAYPASKEEFPARQRHEAGETNKPERNAPPDLNHDPHDVRPHFKFPVDELSQVAGHQPPNPGGLPRQPHELDHNAGGGGGGSGSGLITGGDPGGVGGGANPLGQSGPDYGLGDGSTVQALEASPYELAEEPAEPVWTPADQPAIDESYVRQNIPFEQNVGQADAQYQFLARNQGYALSLSSTSAVLELARPNEDGGYAQETLTVNFVGANADAILRGENQTASRTNYFLGSNQDDWHTNVPNFDQVRVEGLYENIDQLYYTGPQGRLEFDFIVKPGADVSQVRFEITGAQDVTVTDAGELIITTLSGEFRQSAPILYQMGEDSTPASVSGQYTLNEDGTIGFAVGAYDESKPLCIDPVLSFSSYFGGTGADTGAAIAVDGAGNTYFAGSYYVGQQNAYVAKVGKNGSLIYSTIFGGATGTETGLGVAVDLANNAYVVGQTSASDFSLMNPADSSLSGASDGFLTKFNATGDVAMFSTYWGGSGADSINAVSVDALGQAYVTGSTANIGTTSGVFQTTFGGGTTDAFVTKFAKDGSAPVYSTYLGGTGNDVGNGIMVDADGNAYIGGSTTGAFPTTGGAYDTTHNGGMDGFVTKINSTATTKVFSTYLGGTGTDNINGIAVDAFDTLPFVYVTGDTAGGGFPTTGGPAHGGGAADAFLSKLGRSGNALTSSRYVGGSSDDYGYGIALLTGGATAAITGKTTSTNFPTASPIQSANAGSSDAFVATISGVTMGFGTYLGGTGADQGNGIAVDLEDNLYVTGTTASTNFPTQSPFQGGNAGSNDAFVTKILTVVKPPVISSITTDSGSSSTDEVTTDQTLSITGTSTASATIKVYKQTKYLGSTTADGSGNWTYDYTGTTLAEGSYSFTATATVSSVISAHSEPLLVTVDRSAPTVAISAPSSTYAYKPIVEVWAQDLGGLAATATVTLDADLNNDTDFDDASEQGFATGNLSGGYVQIPTNLNATGTFGVRVRITDLAGNEATSSTKSITVNATAAPWGTSNAGVRTAEVAEGNAALQLGDLQLAHALDLDKSPGSGQSGSPALVYNSSLVSVKPIVQATLQTDNTTSLPSTITATLTWNGSAQTPVVFSTTGFSKGDLVTLAVQASTAVTTTGRYAWSLRLQGSGSAFDVTVSGIVYVRAEDASPFGAGWTLSNLNQLKSIALDANGPAGQLWLYGSGGTRFFQEGLLGAYTSPAEDNGTLSKNLITGVFTYTAPDGSTITFDSSGYQTAWTSADTKETLGYTYSSSKLSTLTSVDGGVATFAYANGSGTLLSTIAAPGVRTYTFTETGTDLTTISDPDSKTHTLAYSSHRVTSETAGSSLQNQYHYTTEGLLDKTTWGTSSSPSITTLTSANSKGLAALSLGDPVPTALDARGYTTAWKLDTAGRTLYQRAADSGVTQFTRDSAGRVSTVTDQLGYVTSYTRDSLGYVTRADFPDGNHASYTYQVAYHAMTTAVDERGYTTSYGYDSGNGHLLTRTDALGYVTSYVYESATGLLSTVTDPLNHVATYGYDSSRRLQTVTDYLGTTTYAYEGLTGEVSTVTDALGRVSTVTHDAAGRPLTTTLADGFSAVAAYNNSGLLSTQTSRMGVVSSPSWDGSGRGVATQQTQGVGSGLTRTGLSTLNTMGQATSSRDSMGYTTNWSLDPVGRNLVTTDTQGRQTRNYYNLAGQLLQTIDESGLWTKYTYNSRGWNTVVEDSAGKLMTSTFDAQGHTLTTKDQLGNTSTYAYDALGRVSTSTDSLNHTMTTTYWQDGRTKDVTDPRGYVTRYDLDFVNKKRTVTEAYGTAAARTTEEYFNAVGATTSTKNGLGVTDQTFAMNSLNQVTRVTDGLGHGPTYTLNKAGSVTAVTDALSKTMTVVKDVFERTTETIDATSKSVYPMVNAADQQVGTQDELSQLSRTVFDEEGRVMWQIDGLGAKTRYQYDERGLLLGLTDPVGNKTSWEYDALGQRVKETDPAGEVKTWTYDDAGRMTAYVDRLGRQTDYTYNSAGLLTQEVWKNAGGTPVNTITSTYNERNQRLTVSDSVGTMTSTYDELGRLRTHTDVWGVGMTYTYDLGDRLTKVEDSKGGTKTYVYDDASRTTSMIFSTSSAALRVDWTYNNRDDVTGAKRYDDTAAATLRSETVYTYNDAGYTTNINHKNSGGTSIDSITYTFDNANQITKETSTLGATKTYTLDRTGQVTNDGLATYTWDNNGNRADTGYVTGTANRRTTDGTWTFVYDDEGNETQKYKSGEYWVYAYDNRNRLTDATKSATSGGSATLTIHFDYDAENHRVAEVIDADGAGGGAATTLKMAYEGENAFLDMDNSLNVDTRRVFSQGIDALWARISSSNNEDWYLTDNINSVRVMINSSGTVTDAITYGLFGNIHSESFSAVSDRYMYTMREWSVEAEFQYNRARYMQYGRWMSEDPLGFDAGDSNLQRYVNNRPTMATDPSGLEWRAFATQSWERSLYHTPKKFAHQTAKIQVTLWWDDAGDGKSKFMLTYDVYPGKDEKGAILGDMRKDALPLDYAITEVSSNLRKKDTQSYKGSEEGKVEERLVRNHANSAYAKLKMGEFYRWQMPLGEAKLTDDTKFAGVAGIFCWTDLERLAKGLDRHPANPNPQKVAKPVVIVPADAVVQQIEWSITLQKGAKKPSGKINLTETGWGRNDNQGEGLTTITLPTEKALQSWKDKGYYGPSEVLRPIDSPASTSRGTFPLREAIKEP